MKKTLLAFALFLVVPLSSVFAQEPTLEQLEQADPADFVTVATVNIYDAKIIGQEKNAFDLTFDLSNREFIQPDVRYAVQLLKEDKDGVQSVMDEHIYEEVISLNENQTIKKQIAYATPEYLKGEFDMWLFAKNQNGLTLALANLGKVVLIGNGEFVEIAVDTCYLTVNDDKDVHYTLQQGVDITKDENLTATCDVINHASASMTIVPELKTFWRTSFGQEVPTENVSQESISLNTGEKKQLSFTLPKAQQPQAYDAQLAFKDAQGKEISNHVTFHYVLAGESATIQNLRLDKSYYTKGDTAHASFFWSGSAGGFFGARIAQPDNTKLFAAFAVTDKNGKACIEKTTQELDPKIQTPDFALAITRDCLDPHVTVVVQDESGRALDTKTYDLISEHVPAEARNAITQKPLIFYGGIFVAILFVISLLIIAFKYKKGFSVGIFFCASVGLFLGSGWDVFADTYAYSYGVRPQFDKSSFVEHSLSVTTSLNKKVFSPGESSVIGSISIANVTCQNSLFDYNLVVTPKTGVTNRGTYGDVISSRVFSLSSSTTAPATAGSYNAFFFFQDNRCFSGGACNPSSASSIVYNPNGLYEINKTFQVNSIGWPPHGTSWTGGQIRSACIAAFGSMYNHYTNAGKAEGITPCKAVCDSRASQGRWSIPYTVVAPPAESAPPANCVSPWGTTVLHGRSITAYLAETGSPNCISQTRTCNDGVLSGYYTKQTCTNATVPPAPANCISPWGTTVLHGNSITAYEFATGATCPPHTLICNDGILSGSNVYKYQTCIPNVCPPNRPVDTAICQDDTIYIPDGITSWTNVEIEGQCTPGRKCEYYSEKTQIAPVEKEGSATVIETKP